MFSFSNPLGQFHELEVSDAKIFATQNAAEASCILAKFEEAKDTITEADIMIDLPHHLFL